MFLCKSLLTTTEYKDTVPLASLQDSAIHNLFPIIYINLNFNIHQLCLYIPSTIFQIIIKSFSSIRMTGQYLSISAYGIKSIYVFLNIVIGQRTVNQVSVEILIISSHVC